MGENFLTDDVAVRAGRPACEAYRRQGQTTVGADDAIQPLGRGIWD